MEIRNLKFHKIHKKSKTLVKTVFNGLIFERSVMVKTTRSSETVRGPTSPAQSRLVRRRGRKLRLVPKV